MRPIPCGYCFFTIRLTLQERCGNPRLEVSTFHQAGLGWSSITPPDVIQSCGCFMMFPKIRGTPKWMVYSGKPYENGWFGETHYFRKHPYKEISLIFQKFTPRKINGWKMSSWRFGSDHVPFFSWVICRFQPLIFQGVPCTNQNRGRIRCQKFSIKIQHV